MTAQAVAAGELIEYLTDIVDQHGDIPVIINSEVSGTVESVGRPLVLPAVPAGWAGDLQAYSYASQENAPRTKAALIN